MALKRERAAAPLKASDPQYVERLPGPLDDPATPSGDSPQVARRTARRRAYHYRYVLPAPAKRYRDLRTRVERSVLDAMVKLFNRDPEQPVMTTARQIAELAKVSWQAAARALVALTMAGFLIRLATGERRSNRTPSSFRLTMFPFRGEAPGDEYISDAIEGVRRWRRKPRKRKDVTVKTVRKMRSLDVAQEARF